MIKHYQYNTLYPIPQAECSDNDQQAVHDHCLAATSEQLISMYDAQELEEFFANLNVTAILLVS